MLVVVQKNKNALLILSACIALVAIALATSQPFSSCMDQANNYYSGHADQKGIAYTFVVFKGFKSCFGGYVLEKNAVITALATIVIALFTATIWTINRRQFALSHQVERAYISGGGAPGVRVTKNMRQVAEITGQETTISMTGFFDIHINNHGKTPGILLAIAVNFCETESIPVKPDYSSRMHHRDWIGPGTQSRPIRSVRIPTNLKSPAIYGRFYYRDIFSATEHSCGFIQTFNTRTGESLPLLPPSDEYTNSD